ncbi:hypothetical protein QCA50_003694 [Cerrena zonata]|uniref:Uncharacterized protein n=1 Tax=Cerrena zonata TaxID=2478898 RepID=A0AAW0GL89_9APHY
MKFTTVLTTFAVALFAPLQLVTAVPVTEASLEKRDVFVPPVLYPHAGTVWTSGQRHNVTWDVSNPPKQITNGKGMILLRFSVSSHQSSSPMALISFWVGLRSLSLWYSPVATTVSFYSEIQATLARNSQLTVFKGVVRPRCLT